MKRRARRRRGGRTRAGWFGDRARVRAETLCDTIERHSAEPRRAHLSDPPNRTHFILTAATCASSLWPKCRVAGAPVRYTADSWQRLRPTRSLPGRALRASPPVRGSPRDGVRRGWSLAPGGVLRRRGPAARRPVRARVRGESPTRAHDPRGARGAREVPARPPRRRPRALGARDVRIDATPSRRTPAPPRRAPAREPRWSFLPPGSFSPGGPRGPARSVPSAGTGHKPHPFLPTSVVPLNAARLDIPHRPPRRPPNSRAVRSPSRPTSSAAFPPAARSPRAWWSVPRSLDDPLPTPDARLRVRRHVHEPAVPADVPEVLHEDAEIIIVDKPAGVPSLAGVGPGLSSKNDAVAILNAARRDAARSDDALFEESAERVAGTKRGREEEEEEEATTTTTTTTTRPLLHRPRPALARAVRLRLRLRLRDEEASSAASFSGALRREPHR